MNNKLRFQSGERLYVDQAILLTAEDSIQSTRIFNLFNRKSNAKQHGSFEMEAKDSGIKVLLEKTFHRT